MEPRSQDSTSKTPKCYNFLPLKNPQNQQRRNHKKHQKDSTHPTFLFIYLIFFYKTLKKPAKKPQKRFNSTPCLPPCLAEDDASPWESPQRVRCLGTGGRHLDGNAETPLWRSGSPVFGWGFRWFFGWFGCFFFSSVVFQVSFF